MKRKGKLGERRWARRLRRLYHGEGKTIRAIAEELGETPMAVYRALKAHGIERRRQGVVARECPPEFRHKYENEKVHIRVLAAMYGTSTGTIHRWARDIGCRMRGSGNGAYPERDRRLGSRNAAIRAAREKGVSVSTLAVRHNLSKGWVYRICAGVRRGGGAGA